MRRNDSVHPSICPTYILIQIMYTAVGHGTQLTRDTDRYHFWFSGLYFAYADI